MGNTYPAAFMVNDWDAFEDKMGIPITILQCMRYRIRAGPQGQERKGYGDTGVLVSANWAIQTKICAYLLTEAKHLHRTQGEIREFLPSQKSAVDNRVYCWIRFTP